MDCCGRTAAYEKQSCCGGTAAYKTKTMNIEMKDLFDFVSRAVDAGVQSYIKSIEPTADFIKQNEAKRYIARLGYKPAMLQRWVNGGLLTPVKTGEAQNAVVLYSLSDIKTLIFTLRLKDITNRSEHDYV